MSAFDGHGRKGERGEEKVRLEKGDVREGLGETGRRWEDRKGRSKSPNLNFHLNELQRINCNAGERQ